VSANNRKKLLKGLALTLLAAVLWTAVRDLRFGEPGETAMDDWFLAHAQEEVAANNVVTSIVFDYRGFDTLGEATVLFAAVLGVGSVLRRRKRGEEASE
jgi:multisubunit Na+/H+ antiporter MnhB subunit